MVPCACFLLFRNIPNAKKCELNDCFDSNYQKVSNYFFKPKKDNSNKKKAYILAINQVFLSAFAKFNFLLKCFERMFVLLNILKINKQ